MSIYCAVEMPLLLARVTTMFYAAQEFTVHSVAHDVVASSISFVYIFTFVYVYLYLFTVSIILNSQVNAHSSYSTINGDISNEGSTATNILSTFQSLTSRGIVSMDIVT